VRRRRHLAVALALAAALAPSWLPATAWAGGDDREVLAGSGVPGFSGDGGPATQAMLQSPGGLAVGRDGTLYLCDTGNDRVRAVAPDGTITTVVGTGRSGATVVDGTMRPASIPDGVPATEVDLYTPRALAVGPDGTLYVADELHRVLAVSPGGLVTTVAGTGVPGFSGDGGPAREASLDNATGVTVAADGTLYLGDAGNNRLRAVSPAGVITTVAGNGGQDLTAASGPATGIPLPGAGNPVVDREGTVWFWAAAHLFRLRDGRAAAVTRDDGTWGVSSAGAFDPLGPWVDAGSVAAGDDGVYTYSSSDDAIHRLGAGHVFETVRRVDGYDTSPLLAAAPGHLYLADFTGHRVHRVPVRSVGAYTEHRSWWPYAAAAAGVAVTAGLLVLGVVRRRRSRAGARW
jgi:hypothetical protein